MVNDLKVRTRPLNAIEMQVCESQGANKTVPLKPNKKRQQVYLLTNLQNQLNYWPELQVVYCSVPSNFDVSLYLGIMRISLPSLACLKATSINTDSIINSRCLQERERGSCRHVCSWIISYPARFQLHGGHSAKRNHISQQLTSGSLGNEVQRSQECPIVLSGGLAVVHLSELVQRF